MTDTAAHRRIDYGVPRGKRGKLPQRQNSNPVESATGRFVAMLPQDDDSIKAALADYAAGATLQQIADQHKVSKEAIYGWLLGDLGGQEHAKMVTMALTSRIAQADQLLDSSDTPLNLARAREQARFRRMDLERRRPALYGQHFQQTIDISVDYDGQLRRALERTKTIEGDVLQRDITSIAAPQTDKSV